MIQFTVPGQPVPWARARRNGGRYYNDAKMEAWQRACKWNALSKSWSLPMDGPLTLRVTAFFKIPKSWSKKKRLQAISGELQHITKPDADNISKQVMDSLNRVVYHDDKQIVAASVSKHYSETPRVEIVVDRWHQRKAA